ncbi:RNA polymerase factor sigma-54 [Thermosulfurimonas sp.]|uniref:RNA polymerase factor sigma-54 n=1 Tax=Thermosulfurimonas sp. TaxID=2080236 RepID=UPI0025F91D82|nr:RNA polymerase factor sigma-54 [Thermosulfurimonas sp.]
MALDLKLHLQQRPELLLSPQLRLALKLLQFNRLELEQYLREELERNPVLEVENEHSDLSLEELYAETGPAGVEGSWEDLFEEEFSPYPTHSFEEAEPVSWEARLHKEEDLYGHLLWQVSLAAFSEAERRVAEYIIQNINERGYLTLSPSEIAQDLGVSVALVEGVRERIKYFDPVGVASLEVRECLLAQLSYLGIDSGLVVEIVRDHLSDIPRGPEFLARKLKTSPREISQALEIIRGLEPFPGRAYSSGGVTLYLEPDVIFFYQEGRWRVRLYDEGMPRLRISARYRKLLADPTVPRKAKVFLRERLRSAEWLIRSLDQREKTLLKVAEVLAELQRDFLEKGPAYLRPLNLREVAERVGVHESTVSRVTHHKYAETPHGLFELKFFFPSGLKREGGEAVSSEAVKRYLQELIAAEDPKRPYSDQDLARMLSEQYRVKIARRTVAKYRDLLGIPPARQRRKT